MSSSLRARSIVPSGAALLAVALLLTPACGRERRAEEPPRLRVFELLGSGAQSGFAVADRPRPFTFPADHGPHPDFRAEWWYFTGHLRTAAGRPFGYQLTFFRSALAPSAPDRSSDWATRQAYLAHFALTDPDGRRFYAFERFGRSALELAGARAHPFRVWLEGWSAEQVGAGFLPLRLRADAGGLGVDLELKSAKPPVLQGERGYSRKGFEPANASYYYSFTRMPTRGEIRLEGARLAVQGSSWLDREWSTSALEAGVEGWDWFALQLADGRELMYYRLRREDGSTHPLSAGTLVERDGSAAALAAAEVELEELETWRSPGGGRPYPSRWRLTLPARELRLEIEPLLADQEHRGSFRYWEGAVLAAGREGDEPLRGEGYVELTGYAESARRSSS